MRKFLFTVRNALGDECEVALWVRSDRHPRQYIAIAIRQALRVLPELKPLRVTTIEEKAEAQL